MSEPGERAAKTAAPAIDDLLPQNRNAAVVSAAFDLEDVTLLTVRGIEELSQPFHFEVSVISRRRIRDFARIVGEPMTVALKLADKRVRYFNGMVRNFAYAGLDDGRRPIYVADMVPWLATLEFRRDSRIFRDMTSLDIVKKILGEHPKCLFQDHTTVPVPTRSFCVQYGETDLAFVSRLLESDGIYYYFRHAKNKHEMVLVDSLSGHTPCEPNAIETNLSLARMRARDDCFWHWRESVAFQAAQVVLGDYNFELPNVDLTSISPVPSAHTGKMPTVAEKLAISPRERGQSATTVATTVADQAGSERELFFYPGKYLDRATGEFYARIRSEEIAASTYRVEIIGDVRQLCVGDTFTASNPFEIANTTIAPEPDDKWLALRAEIEITGEREDGVGERSVLTQRRHADGRARLTIPSLSSEDDEQRLYRCAVTAVPATTQYRPPRRTAPPRISGPQTAVVVGLADEVMTTDKYGRIKVQFAWDRRGCKDENSSCWIRVSHTMAGKNFGAIAVPRIGQEVVVEFLNGDPDQPLVIGLVYNATNMPAEELPKDATKTTIRTRTIGGASSQYNELSFDDDPGREETYLRSQKNLMLESGETCEINTVEEFAVNLAKEAPWDKGADDTLFDVSGQTSGSKIIATPESISFIVSTPKGKQAVVINEDGVFAIGQNVGLLSTGGKVTSTLPPVPRPSPELIQVVRDLYPATPNIMELVGEAVAGDEGSEGGQGSE